MGILVDGNNISTTNSGDERDITAGYGMVVVGDQPTYQQPGGVVQVTPSPFAVAPTPSTAQFKWSVASYNSYAPASAPTATSIQGAHADFRSGTGPFTVPTPAPWDITGIVGRIVTNVGFGTQYVSSSDYRLKENITPVENGLDYIMPLRPRRFTWKGGHETVGFIAHELDDDTPPNLSKYIVVGEKDGKEVYVNLYKNGELMLDDAGEPIKRLIPKEQEFDLLSLEGVTWKVVEEVPINQQVDTVGLISPLVSSVQQLKKMIDSQKIKIQNLKSRILILEGVF